MTRGDRQKPDQKGAVAVQIGLMLLVLLALVSLGVEITFVLVKHRQVQTIADAAAMAGVAGLNMNASVDAEAKAVAAQHGLVNGQDGAVVTVNNPPLSGPHAGDGDYVEVIISKPQIVALSKLLYPSDFGVSARAVAVRNRDLGGNVCLLALDTAKANAIDVLNNVNVANPDCGMASNSVDPAAIHLNNNATVTGPVWSHGGIVRDNNATTPNPSIVTYGAAIDDPYASAALPPFSGVCQAAITSSGSRTAGCYRGIDLGNGATLNLSPGVYYIRNQFSLGNQATINATGGVTIVVDGNYALSLGNGAELNISAPSSGVWSGLALMGWSTNSASFTQNFDNNSIINVVGAIYFPSQKLTFSNNVVTSGSRCSQVIGATLRFVNNVAFNYSCLGAGIQPLGPYGSKLAE